MQDFSGGEACNYKIFVILVIHAKKQRVAISEIASRC